MKPNNVYELPQAEERPKDICSIETEQYVLAAMVQDKKLFNEFRGDLEVKHFFDPTHQIIFEAMAPFYNNQELQLRMPLYEHLVIAINIPSCYVSSLVTANVAKSNLPIYIRRLEDRWKRNAQALAASSYIAKVEDTNIPLEEASAELEAHIREINQSTKPTDLLSGRNDIAALLERWDGLARGIVPDRGLMTGLDSIDYLLGGIKKGTLIVLGGQPGTGKTALAINMVDNMVFKQLKKVLFFSLEMDRQLLHVRLVAIQTGMSAEKFTRGPFSGPELEHATTAVCRIAKYDDSLCICELPTITPAKIFSIVSSMGEANKPDIIFVDHLHIVSPTTPQTNEVSKISSIVKELRAMVAQTQIPMVLLSQLNRAADSRPANSEPKLSDLMGSSAIASDSHVVMIAQKAADEGCEPRKRDIDVHVIKNREGRTGIAQLTLTKPTFKFNDKYSSEGY